MSMLINRSKDDTYAVPLKWGDDNDLTDVTAVQMNVYNDSNKTTLIETLDGERRGFDPRTYFPIIDADWTGKRYFQIVLTKDGANKPLPDLGEWRQS